MTPKYPKSYPEMITKSDPRSGKSQPKLVVGRRCYELFVRIFQHNSGARGCAVTSTTAIGDWEGPQKLSLISSVKHEQRRGE